MDWRTYFSFSGRMRRRDLWVFYWLPSTVLSMLYAAAGDEPPLIADVAYLILLAVMVWAGMAGLTRRLHDLNYSLWLWLGLFIGVAVGALVMSLGPLLIGQIVAGVFGLGMVVVSLMAYFRRGTTGDNQYGPDPLEGPGEMPATH